MTLDLLPEYIRNNYEVHEWRHACAILEEDFPEQWSDIVNTLTGFRSSKSFIVKPRGSKAALSQSIDEALGPLGWREMRFSIKYVVEEEGRETVLSSQAHRIDRYKNGIGLEIEWNGNDQTVERHLTSFRSAFDARRLSVGIFIAPATGLDSLFKAIDMTIADHYGGDLAGEINQKREAATSHVERPIPRFGRGRGAGCPIVAFGITGRLSEEDASDDKAARILRNGETVRIDE